MNYTGKTAKMWNYQRWKHFRNFHQSFSTKLPTNLKAANAPKNNDFDMVGPPDPISNLRPYVYGNNRDETCVEKQYREARASMQTWNKNFWTKHNSNFTTERKEFQQALKETSGKDSVTADEMSVFYKRFLDKNWRTHLEYNISWYKQNIWILILEIRVRLSKMKFK